MHIKKNLCSATPTMFWLAIVFILILIVLVSLVEDHNSRVVFGHERFIENKYVPDINDFKQHKLKQLNELDEDYKKKENLRQWPSLRAPFMYNIRKSVLNSSVTER
jgi:hypothetical protein